LRTAIESMAPETGRPLAYSEPSMSRSTASRSKRASGTAWPDPNVNR
jgi:hypothetical protein